MRTTDSVRDEAAQEMRRLIAAANISLLQKPARQVGPFWDPSAIEDLAAAAPPLEAAMLWLFLAGAALPHGDLNKVFGERTVDVLVTAGMLEPALAGGLHSRLLLVSWLNRHVFASPPPGHPRFEVDTVPYCGPESLWYAPFLALRGPYGRCADLCTGTGLMAMLPNATEVLAIDIDGRAAEMASFNVAMNGCTNIVVRQGDLFDGIADRRFDLITANPPFLPAAPNGGLPACGDGGRRGDELLRRILRQAPAHLTDSGEAIIYGEGFGDHDSPAAFSECWAADLSTDHDYTCWIGSVVGADRAIFNLISLWQLVGTALDDAWAHWRALTKEMPASHYYSVLWRISPGTGRIAIRRLER